MKGLLKWGVAAAALGLATAAMASDAEDTRTEKKADAKMAGRNVKGAVTGGKTAGDHVDDAKDNVDKGAAKTRKAARKTGRKVKHAAHDVKDDAQN